MRKGLLFEARSESQQKAFSETDAADLVKLTRAQAEHHLPGLTRRRDDFYGLFIPSGVVVDPILYMNNIWDACQVFLCFFYFSSASLCSYWWMIHKGGCFSLCIVKRWMLAFSWRKIADRSRPSLSLLVLQLDALKS